MAKLQITFVLQSCQTLKSARLNLWWKEVVRNQHVSLEANVSRFPFIFFNLSGFSNLLVTACLLRVLFTYDFYHGTTMIYNTKTISCTIGATYYGKTTWISWKTKRSSVDNMEQSTELLWALALRMEMGPFPLVGLMLTWFIWGRNLALHITL